MASNEANLANDDLSLSTSTPLIISNRPITPSTEINRSSIESSLTSSLSIDHINSISSLIDKYSRKSFMSTVLEYSEHYHSSFVQQDLRLKVILHCQCGTNISLLLRDESSSFILSNYYAHLSYSDCSMMTRILKNDRRIDYSSQSSLMPQTESQVTESTDNSSNTIITDTNALLPISSAGNDVSIKEKVNKRTFDRSGPSSRRNAASCKRFRKLIE